jgi:exopolysaccharide biosynthesis polyprenyl glycosylphosphotransferase
LSTPLNEPVADGLQVVEVLPAEVPEPLLERRPRAFPLSRRGAELIASGGRAGVVFLPVYALLANHLASLRALVAVSALVTAVWYLALRAAFSAARNTLLALGPTVAAALGTATGLVAASALTLWVPGIQISPGRMLMVALSVFVLSAAWEKLVYRSIAGQRRVLVVGAGDGGAELVEELALRDDDRFQIIGVVDDERETDQLAGVPVHGRMSDLADIVEAQRPDLIVLTSDQHRAEAFAQLLEVAGAGFKVVGLPQFYEHAFGRVPLRHLTAVWFMGVLHLYQRPYTRIAKRTFDVALAALGLIITAPLLPFLYLLVRRSPGPVIYRQTRLGEGGKPYTMFKFRTMTQDAEAEGARFATEDDPRATGVGAFLRKTRFDELPQLWNVLRGDMSIVGPRPERPEFWELLQESVPFWTQRHLVKPGITGWAQVSGGYAYDPASTSEKLSYDLWYLRHRSVALDLAICAKTFATLISGAGAR